MLGVKELHQVITPGNSVNIDSIIVRFVDQEFPFNTFYDTTWYQPPPFLESREKQIEMVCAGFNWYMKTVACIP